MVSIELCIAIVGHLGSLTRVVQRRSWRGGGTRVAVDGTLDAQPRVAGSGMRGAKWR
jgi:hypothetical protein